MRTGLPKTGEAPALRPKRRTRGGAPAAESGRAGSPRQAVRWALLILSFVVAVDALVGDKGLLEMIRARRQDAELSGSIAGLRSGNARLREEARRLKEDPAAIEELARKELGLIRPGEVLFVVKDRTKP
ncbi:MAG: FtsB family cell division protein [Vicinamibacterales bacterium]